jgi:hypothetical protein
MKLPMDPSGNWGEQDTFFEGLNGQNAKCSKETTAKIYQEQHKFLSNCILKLLYDSDFMRN